MGYSNEVDLGPGLKLVVTNCNIVGHGVLAPGALESEPYPNTERRILARKIL